MNDEIQDDEDTSVVEWVDRPPQGDLSVGVRLTGDAARDVTDALGTVVRTAKRAGDATNALFLVAPSQEVAQKLADGTLRWATPKHGDASVLIKDAASGHMAAHGQLQKSGLGKALGPVAWQAMAMATQQHYLVSIDHKLDGLLHGLDELLARDEDDKRAELEEASSFAQSAVEDLLSGAPVSSQMRSDAADNHRAASAVWRSLHLRAKRHADAYFKAEAEANRAAGAPSSEKAAQAAAASYGLLMYATRVLAQCGQVMTLLPYEDAAALERATGNARQRLQETLGAAAHLADQLGAGSGHWQQALNEWDEKRFKFEDAARDVARDVAPGFRFSRHTAVTAIAAVGVNTVRHGAKLRHRRPNAAPLPEPFVADLDRLPRAPGPAPQMLVEVLDDGDVVVRALTPSPAAKQPAGTGSFGVAVPEMTAEVLSELPEEDTR